MKLILLTILLLLIGGVLWLLTRPPAPKNYTDDYHQALQQFAGATTAIDQGLERFRLAYGNLAHPEVGARIAALYAPEMYFNDTLKTVRRRDSLVDYMQRTSKMLKRSEVTIESVMRDGSDVFVRWTMNFQTTGDRGMQSTSIGISHLRFDTDGRVVLHQDFWDVAAGLYRHMPVVGYALNKIDQRMIER